MHALWDCAADEDSSNVRSTVYAEAAAHVGLQGLAAGMLTKQQGRWCETSLLMAALRPSPLIAYSEVE